MAYSESTPRPGVTPLRYPAYRSLGKRLSDIVLALLGLLIAAPLMLLIGAVLWAEAPGHVIFAQRRLGRNGRPFVLYKFRKFPAAWGDRTGPSVTVANDMRMTPFGALLERTKLDELPQLWNILKGDMSFVGPRPESPRFGHLYEGEYRQLLDHLPGVFGPAQTMFRNESQLYPPDEDPEAFYERELFGSKARLDLDYYRRAGWFGDLLWVFRGVWASVAGCLQWRRLLRANGRLLLSDLGAIALAWTLANLLRFLGLPEDADREAFLLGLLVLPPTLILSLWLGRCYRYPQRYFSYQDALRLIVVATIAWLLGFLLLLGLARTASLYLAPSGWFVLLPALLFPRVLQRLWAHRGRLAPAASTRVLVYGVDAGGIALANWLRSGSLATSLCGFLDDDPSTRGQFIHGIQVLGGERDLATLAAVRPVDEIWTTFVPDEAKRQRLHEHCREHGVQLVIFPELEPFSRHQNRRSAAARAV